MNCPNCNAPAASLVQVGDMLECTNCNYPFDLSGERPAREWNEILSAGIIDWDGFVNRDPSTVMFREEFERRALRATRNIRTKTVCHCCGKLPCVFDGSGGPKEVKKPEEVGGTHYKQGLQTTPWELQRTMDSTGNAFVDGRRCDAVKYVWRMKGKGSDVEKLTKLAEDMRKAAHCLTEGATELDAHILKIQGCTAKTTKEPIAGNGVTL